jgi:CubicO group peptidase (beta-lactamase class C family)
MRSQFKLNTLRFPSSHFLFVIIGIFFITYSSDAQILDKIKKVKGSITKVTVDKLSKDPVTTSFKDVDKKRYFADDFGNDAEFSNFFEQPFTEGSGYSLQPGFYEGKFQSFCIKAGTQMPTQGRGRFYAPLKGPKADIFEFIINEYQRNPNLTQREVQLLLWAIIAKTDFQKMQGPVKATALKILTPQQIVRLSKGALSSLARKELNKITYSSNALQAIIKAENDLRAKYYSGVSSYEQYEEIAMIAGVEPLVPDYGPGRWTRHPDGFFIRYFPHGYSATTAQIYVPESGGTKFFDPTNAVAVPASSGQRLLQTGLPTIGGSPNTGGGAPSGGSSTGGTATGGSSGGGTIGNHTDFDSFCEPVFHPGVDKVIKEQMIMQGLPGVAVAVFTNGKMVHIKTYGYRDLYKEIPINLNTKMEWASISKSVTGVAAAQLEEKGISGFKVSHKANRYVDNWKNVTYTDTSGNIEGTDARLTSITIDQLLNNTSGIQHYGKGSRSGDNNKYSKMGRNTFVEFIEDKNYTSPPGVFDAKKAVSVFNKSVLDFNPGKKWFYSSYGFVLAGAAIDDASPNGYVDWVQRNIANKIGMRSFSIAEPPGWGHNKTWDGILTSNDSNSPEWTLPAGGYQSNICDLAKYAYALSTGKLFENQKDLLWNNNVTAMVRNNILYSYGLYFIGMGNEFRVYHGGHGGNSRSYMHFFPSDSTGIALMAAAEYANLPEMTKHIFQELNVRPTLYSGLTTTPYDECERGMKSDKDRFYGIWRKTNDDVIIRTGMKGETFFEEVSRLEESDYHCFDMEPFLRDGILYWDGVFKKEIPKRIIVKGLTTVDFLNRYTLAVNNGYVLIDIENYKDENGSSIWAGIFQKGELRQKVKLGVSKADFTAANIENQSNGLKLIDIEVTDRANSTSSFYSGVWVEGAETMVEMDIKQPEFKRLVHERTKLGYRVLDIEYYWTDNNQHLKIAAIWEKSGQDELVTGDGFGWKLFCDFMSDHDKNSRGGYELLDWERETDRE